MPQLSFLDDDPPEFAARLRPRLRDLARQGVFLGTSSWKYEGWIGQIYSSDRYATRGRFSDARFQAGCLREYAETFPTVCGDFSFYQFPTAEFWRQLFGDTPETFQFAFKVPEEITVPIWPNHARYGIKAGAENPGFLDADLFTRMFARPLESYRDRVACLIFEFGTMSRRIFADPSQFFERLNDFLGAIPEGLRPAVEIRNAEYLGPAYFDTLAAHRAAHVFSAWGRMPEIGDQIAMPGAFTTDFTVARALMSRGETYEQSKSAFEPFNRVQRPNLPAREALRSLATRGRIHREPTFLYVGNRLEGNSPGTIAAVVEPEPQC